MNIVVNGTPLMAPISGIGQYIRHLFSAMKDIPGAEITTFYGTRFEKGFTLPSSDGHGTIRRVHEVFRRFVPYHRSLRRIAEQAGFALQSSRLRERNFLYHEPTFVPLPYSGPTVITVCDLSCFDLPETHPAERVRLMQKNMPAAIERADHVIVISDSAGTALRRWFNIAPERMTRTYLAADSRFRPRSTEELGPGLAALDLKPGGYVLSVGTLEPRKNLETLFSAYALLPKALRHRFPLVVAGMIGWRNERLVQAAAALQQSGELRFLGHLPDASLPDLYSGAAVFAYPSRYEGFGLPVLEAMASGVPVLASNATALPEVIGNAGLMVHPDNVEGMREVLHQLLEDREFAGTLSARGLVRADSFSWAKCAQETFSVYENVMRSRGYVS